MNKLIIIKFNNFVVKIISPKIDLQRFFDGGANLIIGTEISVDHSRSNVLRNIYTQPEQFTNAGFAQFRKPISNKLMYDIGLRYDNRDVTGGEGYSVKSFQAFSPKCF